MRSKHYFNYILLLCIVIGFSSCLDDEIDPYYTQPTRDDLTYLHFNQDSILFTGETIEFLDTLQYVYNDSISIPAFTKTLLYFSNNPWGNPSIKSMNGKTTIRFDSCAAIESAEVSFIRYYGVTASNKKFSVKANDANVFDFIPMAGIDDSTSMDTALVRGTHYQNVIRFDPSDEFETNLKSVLFSKSHGYIRIETMDGELLELSPNN